MNGVVFKHVPDYGPAADEVISIPSSQDSDLPDPEDSASGPRAGTSEKASCSHTQRSADPADRVVPFSGAAPTTKTGFGADPTQAELRKMKQVTLTSLKIMLRFNSV